MIVNDATRIRVIRAILGMNSGGFAARLGVCPASVTNWEQGRTGPTSSAREELAKLCQQNGIGFTPSGYPFPASDCMMFKPQEGK
jgi:DNA-binding transcriptional regulator YiaG